MTFFNKIAQLRLSKALAQQLVLTHITFWPNAYGAIGVSSDNITIYRERNARHILWSVVLLFEQNKKGLQSELE